MLHPALREKLMANPAAALQDLSGRTHTDYLNILGGGAAHLAGQTGFHTVGTANVAGPGSFMRIGLQDLRDFTYIDGVYVNHGATGNINGRGGEISIGGIETDGTLNIGMGLQNLKKGRDFTYIDGVHVNRGAVGNVNGRGGEISIGGISTDGTLNIGMR